MKQKLFEYWEVDFIRARWIKTCSEFKRREALTGYEKKL